MATMERDMKARQPRNSWWLFLSMVSFSGLAWLVNTYPPQQLAHRIIFFLIVFLSVFFLFLYLLKRFRWALLIGVGAVTFLWLRLITLREPLYVALLIASLLSLELFFRKR